MLSFIIKKSMDTVSKTFWSPNHFGIRPCRPGAAADDDRRSEIGDRHRDRDRHGDKDRGRDRDRDRDRDRHKDRYRDRGGDGD